MVGGDELMLKRLLIYLNHGKFTLVGPVGSGQIAKLANQI